MRNIKLVLQYDGTDYSGWQSQKQGETTLQSVLEDRMLRLTGRATRIVGSGRTDAGVHALGQVAHCRTSSGLDVPTMQRALNAMLPDDIRVVSVEEVDGSFHPRYSAVGKRYAYLIVNSQNVSPFLNRYLWRVPKPLNLREMKKAADAFVGEHDFKAFMASGSNVKSTVRELWDVSVTQRRNYGFLGFSLQGKFIRISLEGSGFLRHMVRNIVGTLVEVGKGKIDADAVQEIIAAKKRKLSGPTAPAMGLFLEKVFY
jgi:tRNA pseudouridine38-40 synthase